MIIQSKIKSAADNLVLFMKIKLSNFNILNNISFGNLKLLSNIFKDKKKSSILKLIKNVQELNL